MSSSEVTEISEVVHFNKSKNITGDSNLDTSRRSKSESGLGTTGSTSGQVHLSSYAIDEFGPTTVDLLDQVDYSSQFSIRAIKATMRRKADINNPRLRQMVLENALIIIDI